MPPCLTPARTEKGEDSAIPLISPDVRINVFVEKKIRNVL